MWGTLDISKIWLKRVCVGGIGREMLEHFAFRKGELSAVFIWRRATPLGLPGVSFILRVKTKIVKLLVWTTTWSCSLIGYWLYNKVLSSKSSE